MKVPLTFIPIPNAGEESVSSPLKLNYKSRFLVARCGDLLGMMGSGKGRPCHRESGDLLRMTGRRCRSFDRWSPCVAFSHHQVPASHGPLEAAERRYSGPRKGQGFQPRPRVSTFGFTAGPQLTAALSQGRGYGEAGDEGLFCSAKPADPSPTASRSPLSRKRARAIVN